MIINQDQERLGDKMDNALVVHQLIEQYAEQNPNHIAVVFGEQSLSYGELNQKANQLAHYLHTFPIQPDTLIALSIPRSLELIVAILGILKAGCAYLPLDETHPAERLLYILNDGKVSMLITISSIVDKFAAFQGKKIKLDNIWDEMAQYPASNPASLSSTNNLAYVIYTSGSTGNPKGVLIEHKSVVNYINWFAHYSACHAQDKIDFSTNIIFDMAVTSSITAMVLGLQIYICTEDVKRNITDYLQYLSKAEINLIKITPSYFKLMCEEVSQRQIDLHALQAIILGGENLLTLDCINWLAIYPQHQLFNEYGPTETTVAVTQFNVNSHNVLKLGKSVPIGKPGYSIECHLLDDNNNLIKHGEMGELYVSGVCLARGYLNNDILTNKQFINLNNTGQRWYRTGDICCYLPDGNIEFIRRIDDQVKIRGYRIETGEIEACLATHPQVKSVAVIPHETEVREMQLVAYIILHNKSAVPTKNDLRNYLRQRLVDYMIPANFVFMDKFPLTENEKLDKKAFPAPIIANEDAALASASMTEQKLIDIWCEVFHRDHIGLNTSFFELGGHSLTAARIISKIQMYMNKRITLKDLYNAKTIKQLAYLVDTADGVMKDNPRIASVDADSVPIPLSDFQLTFWISSVFEPKIKKLNIIARRRVAGALDISALTFAFQAIFKKHQILTYHIAKFYPAQYLDKNISFKLIEIDLRADAEAEREAKLSLSLDDLLNQSKWPRHQPLILARLFYLADQVSELQICVPHIVFDDTSEEVLFSELSNHYQLYKSQLQQYVLQNPLQYADYVMYERNHLNQHLNEDIEFWRHYLSDTRLLQLPSTLVIHDMEEAQIPYSTYHELPLDILRNMQNTCADFNISVTDILCAAITLSLQRVAGPLNKDNIYINIIRSTRDNDMFSRMIGCFIRLDPIKVDINSNKNLIELAKSIQQSRIDTEQHQTCSGMVKLACLDKSYLNQSVKNQLVKLIASAYSKLFTKSKLNPDILAMYGRLNSLRFKNEFLINVNLLNNFVATPANPGLFGHDRLKMKVHRYDLSIVDNVLEVCLLRNESMDEVYLVISGNLDEGFRQQLASDMTSILRMITAVP